MATAHVEGNDGSESDFEDSRKRPSDSELDNDTKRSHHGVANGTYHFKILVPSVAAGAIIGKGGETIAQLQKETGTRVKMSKATDFYPGTRERVCLITGNIDGILKIHEFIMEKIKEKPDPNAKLAIDFDHKQPAEREKQVKILVPNSTVGMIMGKGGSYIKQIKEKSGAYVQISQKSKDHALVERCITVIGEMENNKIACELILMKIVQDPQSGNCLNVSYADVTGPIANFNPTGSPFANPNSISKGTMNNSNTSYSSNDSLNSLSPTVTNSFHSPQTSTTGVVTFSAAMNTLANYNIPSYNILGLCINGNGPPMVSGMGMGMPNSAAASCPMPPGGMSNQGMYTSTAGVPGMDAASAMSDPMGAGSSIFSPIGSLGNGVSGLGLGPGFTSPTTSRSSDRFLSIDRLGPDMTKIEIEVGENIVGAILGPGGKALVEIQRFSGANIQISKKGIFAPGTRNRIVTITGLPHNVSTAQYLIERQVGEEEAKRAQQNAMGILH
ncbi:unnamed protein product [Larinioides sclopetarius]|uniref:K Homology domain-containing protein n=1 Tax=Larinioides sclopetarius TaxID=280406 RepID=A0AAV2ATP1_9ARAC